MSNIYVIDIPERRENRTGEVMTEEFQKLQKDNAAKFKNFENANQS